jgi:hypothetical protein
MSKQHIPGSKALPEESKGLKFASRRTVVKGMASAVPVVMTLGNGAALAQSSGDCAPDHLTAAATCDPAIQGDGLFSKGTPVGNYGCDYNSLDSTSAINSGGGLYAKGSPVGPYGSDSDPLASSNAFNSGGGLYAKGSPVGPYGSASDPLASSNALNSGGGLYAKGSPSGWYIDSTESLSSTGQVDPMNASAGCSIA